MDSQTRGLDSNSLLPGGSGLGSDLRPDGKGSHSGSMDALFAPASHTGESFRH
jgi:hypothetical protein